MPKAKVKQAAGMSIEKDELGKDVLLKDGSLQVMMEWERPYLEACIKALQPKGDVLEIGFGLGYSSEAIQQAKPKSHTIIECDPAVLDKAKDWAKKHKNVNIIAGMWQDELDKLGVFDTIFFDDYTPLSSDELKQLKEDTKHTAEAAAEAKTLKNQLAEMLKQFKNVKFSDEDLKKFSKDVLNRPNTTLQDITDFIHNLAKMGNITKTQAEKFLQDVEKKSKGKMDQGGTTAAPMSWINRRDMIRDHLVSFVEVCLDHHMKKGSRLSCHLTSPDSKLQNKEFQKKVISRKDVTYTEKTIPVKVPENCTYFQGDKALIIIIEKK